ncbi:MAG: VOC family protein [Planctomycetaceae bacterium]|jgi:methylmalonyl-CoA/ethylmalonyl-CoA epimerase|nr:VOC family protein [Planctomycetaceae bacterium]
MINKSFTMEQGNVFSVLNCQVHHVGYAVHDIERAGKIFTLLNFQKESSVTKDVIRNINIQFWRNQTTLIELISILDGSQKSPVDFLFKKKCSFPGNGMPYHICYVVDGLEQTINQLKKEKFFVIQPPMQAPALENRHVAFLVHNDIGMIELLEK